MASPMVEGRIDPHKKAGYTLEINDRIADGEVGDYTSVRYNHKPVQSTSSRTTRLLSPSASTSSKTHTLHIEDEKPEDKKDVFIFTGQKTSPKKSYILLFDLATQKATLEPLASSYTFNVSTKNGTDMSSTYPKIYPRKQKDEPLSDVAAADELLDDCSREDVNIAPDPDNPFDFRHFLKTDKGPGKGDESDYNSIASPDYRPSAKNTPQTTATARKPTSSLAASKAKPKTTVPAHVAPKPKKRKSPEPESKKTTGKKLPPPPPKVRLERRATTDQKPKSTTASARPPTAKTAAGPSASKIKSAEIVHSSDESDEDEDTYANVNSPPQSQLQSQSQTQPRYPSPQHQPENHYDDSDLESDSEHPNTHNLELEFENPDIDSKTRTKPKPPLRPNISYLASPANGPISLASAVSSVENTPRGNRTVNALEDDDGVIDFGDFGGGGAGSDDEEEEEDAEGEWDGERDGDGYDRDVEPMDIGSPAAQTRRVSIAGVDLGEDADADAEGEVEVEEEDPLYKEMMEGLAGGDSSEESEEE